MSLPACCVPHPAATRAERLFCAYNNSGPVERRGLTYDNKEVPSWAVLQERARNGDVGAQGVISKWEAVASSGGITTDRFDGICRMVSGQAFIRRSLAYGACGMSDPGLGMVLSIQIDRPEENARWRASFPRDLSEREQPREIREEDQGGRLVLLVIWDRLD